MNKLNTINYFYVKDDEQQEQGEGNNDDANNSRNLKCTTKEMKDEDEDEK